MNTSKTILVTGANRGLGLGFCKHYLQKNDHVFAAARNTNTPQLKSLLSDYPKQFHLIDMDITDIASIKAAFEKVKKSTDHIDLLINNAGRYGLDGPLSEDINTQDLLLTYQTNVIGPMLVTKTFLPLIERGASKKIVHLSTLMASIQDNQSSGSYGYRMSKSALNMMSKNLSIDLKGKGILSVVLHPGWVKTDMGGPNAPLDVDTSVEAMIGVIKTLSMENSGSFLDYRGNKLAY